MSVIIKDLEKKYNNKIVLNKVNVEFEDNDISCITGHSGCGKTTLLNIILGIIKADSGWIFGTIGKRFSVVFQEDRLCENFSAVANIKLVCERDISETLILDNLRQVGIYKCDNKRVNELSGGMRRRIAIVRAMMAKSDIIIMDEPFKGLDEETKLKVIDYVIRHSKKKTVIITTHNLEEVDLLKATLIKM